MGKNRDAVVVLIGASVAALVGFAMCILPGVLIVTASIYALPAMLAEGCTPIDALKRSAAMAKAEPLDTAALSIGLIVAVSGLASIPVIGFFLVLPLPTVMATIAYRALQS